MKLFDLECLGVNEDVVIIPRQYPKRNIVFKVRAVLNADDFDKLCPEPLPPEVIEPGGGRRKLVNDPKYLEKVSERNQKMITFLFLRSLEATEGLSWSKVDMSDHETWNAYVEELTEFGLTPIEIGRLMTAAMQVNALNDTLVEKAKQDFLAGQLTNIVGLPTSQSTEQPSTQSSESVSD